MTSADALTRRHVIALGPGCVKCFKHLSARNKGIVLASVMNNLYANRIHRHGTGEAIQWLGTDQRGADWWIAHLPAARVVFWDVDDLANPKTKRNTAATVVVSSELSKLSKIANDHEMIEMLRKLQCRRL